MQWLGAYLPLLFLPHGSKVVRYPEGPWEDVADFGDTPRKYETAWSWQLLRVHYEP